MKTLLIVYHTGGVKTAKMAEAVERGARNALKEGEAEADVLVIVKRAVQAGPEDVLAADALILGTRIMRTVLFYFGPYLQRSSFKFDFRKPGNPDSHGAGDIRTVGGHVGLALHAGRFSSFLLEFSRARVDAPGDRATLDTTAATYQLDF